MLVIVVTLSIFEIKVIFNIIMHMLTLCKKKLKRLNQKINESLGEKCQKV